LVCGNKAKDRITEATGTITACCEYLYGEARFQLEGVQDGKPFQIWIEKSRAELVE